MAMTVTAPVALPRRAFYVGLSLFMALIAVAGFWATYFGPLVMGRLAQPAVIHLHAIVFTGWLMLFSMQVVFAATGRVSAHLRLGRIGIVYGVGLILVGLATAVVRSPARGLGGPAERLLFISLIDMCVFAAFFFAAIRFRRKPQFHRRLMTVAATALLVAAVFRLSFVPPPPVRLPLRFAIWSTPILLAIAYDFKKQHRVHPIYLMGLGAFAVRVWTEPFAATPAWGAFSRWVFSFGF